jgi:hypothetical protein
MSAPNFEELSDKIVAIAKTGSKDGFIIKMGRKTGKSSYDPLTPDYQSEEIVYDQKKTFYKHSMSAQDYKRYQDVRKKLSEETDEEKRVDLTLRLYEYLAMKFLGMTHDEFVSADFDDVVVATLACDALFGSGSGTAQQQQPQEPLVKRLPYPRMEINNSKNAYYKAPDEE